MHASFWRTAYAAVTAEKRGPTLHDLCDPVLRHPDGGDPHFRKFYRTALANPVLRVLLCRAGLPQLREEGRFHAAQEALRSALHARSPDWAAIGRPVAALLDEFPQSHPKRAPVPAANRPPPPEAQLERIIRACARHLTGAFRANGFIPAYAAFNLVGDPDFRGRELLTALEGLNARTYRNATLLFNLARAFVLANPPVAALLNPSWRGLAERIWQPVQIRHRSAYYDAFFAEALMDFLRSGPGSDRDGESAYGAIKHMVRFCVETSRESVRAPQHGGTITVVTAIAPPPHSRMSRLFWRLKTDLGFGLYVPDCDTTSCALSAATQFGYDDAILHQPLLDFFATYQAGNGHSPTVTINDNIEFDGGVATWIENAAGEAPFGNDLDPTLNLDVLEVAFRNHERWQIVEQRQRLEMLRGIIRFHHRLAESGAFADPRSHVYYLPELYCAYFGRCYAAFRQLPRSKQQLLDRDGSLELIRRAVLAYVRDELMAAEMNPFDAALALLALAKLGAEPETFTPALHCIADAFGEGRRAPFKAYEWNKMKTPTRILVGGAEVTSAFVLSALVHARARYQ
jgi:hypothetical protein